MFSKNCGFTLIELLIVISITGILSSLGLVAYNEFNRKQILDQSAKTLKNNLRLVQSKASSGEKNSICGETVLEGWYVQFANNSYTYYGLCGENQFNSQTINLPVNVTIPSPPSTIYFKPLAKGASSDITITLSAFGKTQAVSVTVMGEIN